MVYSTGATLLIATLATAVQAANDWNVPCLFGECSYDLPATAGSTASGTVKIWGSDNAISDITNAAGWEILPGCSGDVEAQDIRIVCNMNDERSAGCKHLLSGAGPEGKIVRLPESCGANAFARVAKSYISDDQSLPASIAARVVRRDGSAPQVRGLRLDTNFGAVDVAKSGKVNIAIQGATVSGAQSDIVVPGVNSRRAHPRAFKRQVLGGFVDNAIDAISNLNEFDVENSLELEPINIDEQFNLFNQAFGCGATQATVNVDVAAQASALVTVGVAATGTLVPPDFSDFSIITNFDADLAGTLTFSANALGTLDSGKIQLFELGIPGLDFPGILTVGPSFEVSAQASASLDVGIELEVGLNYKAEGAEVVFPPKAKEPAGDFNIADTPLTLSVTPSVKAVGTIEAHIIPAINLGLSALGDTVEANVFINLDASAILELTLEATAGDLVAGTRRALRFTRETPGNTPVAIGWKGPRGMVAQEIPVAMKHATPMEQKAMAHQMDQEDAADPTGNVEQDEEVEEVGVGNDSVAADGGAAGNDADLNGCFAIRAGLAVNAGAEGAFFGLFDASTEVELFSKEFELFEKCFGNQANAKRSIAPSRLTRTAFGRRQSDGLECPPADLADPVLAADEDINAADIKEL